MERCELNPKAETGQFSKNNENILMHNLENISINNLPCLYNYCDFASLLFLFL